MKKVADEKVCKKQSSRLSEAELAEASFIRKLPVRPKKKEVAQVAHGKVGNTKPLSPPQSKRGKHRGRSRRWTFTINNYAEEKVAQLIELFGDKSQYIIGREIGEEKTPHLQGYVEFKFGKSFSAVKKLMPAAHIEKARGDRKQNWEYCSKDGNYETNIDLRTFKEKMMDMCLLEYKDVVWKPWQKVVLDLKNDPRTINWFWEPDGNVGKSYLVKYLALTRNVIICEGKKGDVFNQVNTALLEEKCPELIVCDIPRTSVEYINYGVLEKLKDGCIYSGKYEGGVCVFPSPLIICFANRAPDRSTMSEDRWNIIRIDEIEMLDPLTSVLPRHRSDSAPLHSASALLD